MVAGDEHCQLRAAIEVLVPYSSVAQVAVEARQHHLRDGACLANN